MSSLSPQREKALKLNDQGHIKVNDTAMIPIEKFKATPVQLETRNNPNLMKPKTIKIKQAPQNSL